MYPHHVSCFRHYAAYFGYIWVCLEKVKTLFYEYLDFTVVVTQLIKSVESPSALGILGCFCPILYYVSIIAENHLTFSCKFLRSVVEICEYIRISNSTYLLIFIRYCFQAPSIISIEHFHIMDTSIYLSINLKNRLLDTYLLKRLEGFI